MSTGLSGLKISYSLTVQEVDSDLNILSTTVIDPSISLASSITSNSKFNVPTGTIDKEVPLTDLFGEPEPTIDFLLIRASGAITFKLESTSAAPLSIRSGGVVLLDSANITALYISNASGAAVVVQVIQGVS